MPKSKLSNTRAQWTASRRHESSAAARWRHRPTPSTCHSARPCVTYFSLANRATVAVSTPLTILCLAQPRLSGSPTSLSEPSPAIGSADAFSSSISASTTIGSSPPPAVADDQRRVLSESRLSDCLLALTMLQRTSVGEPPRPSGPHSPKWRSSQSTASVCSKWRARSSGVRPSASAESISPPRRAISARTSVWP
eukprot:6205347-Pleurochrysis_carterae.AAC.2